MIYLASPYSHQDPAVREERFRAVCVVCAKLMSVGHHVFSPIAHTHPVAVVGDLPKGFDFWREYDWWFVSRVDAVYVLMLDGWKDSIGVASEIIMANDLNIPIKYLTAEGDYASVEETGWKVIHADRPD